MTMTEREPELCDFEPQPMDLKPEQKIAEAAEASNSAPLETVDPIASECHEVGIEQYSAIIEDNYVIAEYHDIVEDVPLPSSSSEEGEEDQGIPGGPEDKSLLTSFKQHVAYKIWKGKERPLLKLLHHGNKLEQWDLTKESELFRAKVQASGLSTLALYTYKHISRVLVCAFVERWHPETNTFHLPFGEMTVTLDDVKQILGIPIRGKGFIGSPSIQLDEATRLLQKGLGLEADEINKELAACRGVAVRVGWLKSNLSRRANENDSILDCSVRGYLLYLLGCTLFSDKTGTKVPVVYMRMLMEVDKVHEYAWGACGLAFLYRQLGLATRNNVKQISGYLTLFEAWVREHFRIGGPTPNSTYREEWPRVRRWKSKTSTGDSVAQLIYTREELDSMTAKEVIWDPYGKTREYHEFDEVAFFSGCLTCFDIVEPYHPDRVLRQFSRTQNIPDAPFAPTEVNRPRSGKGYKVVYPVMEQYWARWRNHLLAVEHRGEPVRNPWDCEPEYIEWFRRISHPQVQNPERSTGTQRPVDVSEPILMTQLAEPMLITQLADWRSTKSKALTLLKESLVLGLDQNVSTMLRTMQETYDILSQGDQDDEDATQYLSNGRKEKGVIISKQNDKRLRKKRKVDLL